MVHSLLVLRGGDVVAGGSFQKAGDTIVNGLARWNGTAWSRVTSPIALAGSTFQSFDGTPLRLVSGALVIGGYEYPQVITTGYPVELDR